MGNNCCEQIEYSVIIPIFNEQDSILPLFSRLKQVMDNLRKKYEVIFIDDGSSDSSQTILNELSKAHENIRTIRFDSNRGQGKAMEVGFKNARGRIIITMDGDLQNEPSDIPNLLAKINMGFDVVCGWRAKRSDTLIKKIKSRIGNFLQRKITHLSLHDLSCTLRAYRKEMVEGIVFKGKFDFSILPYIISRKKQARIIEVKVNDNYRKFGKTKYKPLHTIVGTIYDYIRIVIFSKMSYKDKINSLEEGLQPHYEHHLPIVRFYWHRVMRSLSRQIEAKEDELILDFGCGRQQLKRYLPKHAIIGYDIIDKYSDVGDFKNLRPHTIVCSHVLEHLTMPQLLDTIADFTNMGGKFLITAQPTENWLSRISNLLGRPKCITSNLKAIDHRSNIKEIHDTLSKFYELKERNNVLTLTTISKWAPKK